MVAHLRIFILITVISVAVYANSFYNSFHFDDQHYIVTNPYITVLSNIPSFFKSPQYSSFERIFTGHYRPLLVTSYAINYAVGGLNPVGYHLVNLGFHIGSAFLVFLILATMRGSSEQVALAAALIFAVHPFNSEVMNYITARSSVMCAFFYLLAFYCWMKFREVAGTFFYIASLLAFLLAMLTKEIAITLPVMFFLYDLYFSKIEGQNLRSHLPLSPFGKGGEREILGKGVAYLPFILLIALPYLIYRFLYYGGITGGMSPFFVQNLLTQPKVLLKYLQLMTLPVGLTIEHDITRSDTFYNIMNILSIIALLLTITASYILFKKGGPWRMLSFFILWFFITLLPTTLIPLNAILQENRGYLSGVVFPLFVGIGIVKMPQRLSKAFLLILISLYSIITIQHNYVWKDEYTLWADAVAKSPASARAHDNLGLTYIEKGEYDLAIAEFKKTLDLNPFYYLAYYNAGVAYQLQNRIEMARSSYEECIKINPQYFRAYFNLGIVYKKEGDLDKAIAAYEKAISIDPRHAFVYNNLGVALTEKGEMDKAESIFKRAIEMDPGYAKSHFNLGNLYYKAGKYDSAIAAYRAALRLEPDYKEAQDMLKAALDVLAKENTDRL